MESMIVAYLSERRSCEPVVITFKGVEGTDVRAFDRGLYIHKKIKDKSYELVMKLDGMGWDGMTLKRREEIELDKTRKNVNDQC